MKFLDKIRFPQLRLNLNKERQEYVSNYSANISAVIFAGVVLVNIFGDGVNINRFYAVPGMFFTVLLFWFGFLLKGGK